MAVRLQEVDVQNDEIRREILCRAVALGDELVRLTDDLGMTLAATHICQGVEMMREAVEQQ